MERHSECKVDSAYKSVREQTDIQAGEEGYHINVGGKTVLDGAAIASTADPGRNYFRTGSLEWNDIVNEAKFKATSASVSGGGGSGRGGGMSGSFQQKSDHATSITKASIADGTLIVDDGSGEGIARGVTELQKDGLKEIFNAQKVGEQLEIQRVAGELGFQAAGTLAEKYGWIEGSKEKVALHAAVGAIAPAKRNTGETILGQYPEYVDSSELASARRFEIPESAWNKMSEADRWKANRKFLDRTAERGDAIGLATPPRRC